jgi:hypothetical protein
VRCHSSDHVEHISTAIGFTEERRAARRFGARARLGIIVSGDIDEGGIPPFRPQALAELDPGHSAQADIQDEAVESRMLRIGEERLS